MSAILKRLAPDESLVWERNHAARHAFKCVQPVAIAGGRARYGRMLLPRFLTALTALALALQTAAPVRAEEAGDVHATYQTYAAGLNVAETTVDFGFGRWSYQMHVAFHTTGLVGFFYSAHQVSTVTGSWTDDRLTPREYVVDGLWRDQQHTTLIEYQAGKPLVRTLVPPNEPEREKVPPDLQANTVDILSALAGMIRNVALSGHCEVAIHTYDGRTAAILAAHTAGTEVLQPTERSMFSGPALRCDFEGRRLAGFLTDDSVEARARPLHGSVWLASLAPGEAPMPVRMTFGTRWFGDPMIYLTSANYLNSAGLAPPTSNARAGSGTSVNAAAVAAPAVMAGRP